MTNKTYEYMITFQRKSFSMISLLLKGVHCLCLITAKTSAFINWQKNTKMKNDCKYLVVVYKGRFVIRMYHYMYEEDALYDIEHGDLKMYRDYPYEIKIISV